MALLPDRRCETRLLRKGISTFRNKCCTDYEVTAHQQEKIMGVFIMNECNYLVRVGSIIPHFDVFCILWSVLKVNFGIIWPDGHNEWKISTSCSNVCKANCSFKLYIFFIFIHSPRRIGALWIKTDWSLTAQ